MWIDGAQFRLNGVRLNLIGDYAAYDPICERHWPKELLTRKDGCETFRESFSFQVEGAMQNERTSSEVTLRESPKP